LNQFLRFCAVGTVGFVIDAVILQLLVLGIGMSPYLVRIISFLVAASATWLMNRHYTFKVEHRATHSEWARYIALTPLQCGNWRAQPWLGVAVGSVAGLAINFLTSQLLAFRNVGT
jgi:putative flippase GtrA